MCLYAKSVKQVDMSSFESYLSTLGVNDMWRKSYRASAENIRSYEFSVMRFLLIEIGKLSCGFEFRDFF